MSFKSDDRVVVIDCPAIKGTITKDDGEHVWVEWDDGKSGILQYKNGVAYNAYRLQKVGEAR